MGGADQSERRDGEVSQAEWWRGVPPNVGYRVKWTFG